MPGLKVAGKCPLGDQCESVTKDGVERCNWLVKIRGRNPQSQEEYDEWRCAIAWIPILLVENSKESRGVNAAVVSLRDEMVQRQDFFNNLLVSIATKHQEVSSAHSLDPHFVKLAGGGFAEG